MDFIFFSPFRVISSILNSYPSSSSLIDTVESLAEIDETIEELYFTHDCVASKVPPLEISDSIRRQFLSGKVTPVCVGSGLTGVLYVLDCQLFFVIVYSNSYVCLGFSNRKHRRILEPT